MAVQPTRDPVVIPRGSTSAVALGSSGRARLKVLNQREGETGYALVEGNHPGGQPVIRDHLHDQHDETFVVIEGRYEVRLGDDIIEATPGDYVYVPRGTPHTYRNRGPGPARVLNIISPADGVELLIELGALAGVNLSEEELVRLHARHQAVLVEPLAAWRG